MTKNTQYTDEYLRIMDELDGDIAGRAAAFAYMAKFLGYTNVYGCNSGGHGWVEIDGKVYDPEWTQHRPGNYFGRELRQGDSPNYLGSVARTGNSWQYRKI